MCLKSVLHLQAVFETPEEAICIREFAAFGLCDESAVGESSETHHRVRHAQPVVASSSFVVVVELGGIEPPSDER